MIKKAFECPHPRTTIKGKSLVDFIAESIGPTVPEATSPSSEKKDGFGKKTCELYTDGFSLMEDSGAGLVFPPPNGGEQQLYMPSPWLSRPRIMKLSMRLLS